LFADFPHRHKIGPSRLLWGATAAFMVVAAGSVFHCAAAYAGPISACVAAIAVTAGLAAAASRGEQRRPIAFEIGQDGLTTWDRAGNAQYRRIAGCAQWSDRLLALILVPAEGRPASLLVSADALTNASAFRELAVRARRCAQEHL
jgi:anti-sigma-K factor RskA